MIRFEKVSLEQFKKDFERHFPHEMASVEERYMDFTLPQRKTAGSAGYDFVLTVPVVLHPGESACIPTGVRVLMPENVVLLLAPRSGLGVRYRFQLANTIGIIDSDYAMAANEGHILVTVTNDTRDGQVLSLEAGEGFVQGILLPFLKAQEESIKKRRIGGFGSTDRD